MWRRIAAHAKELAIHYAAPRNRARPRAVTPIDAAPASVTPPSTRVPIALPIPLPRTHAPERRVSRLVSSRNSFRSAVSTAAPRCGVLLWLIARCPVQLWCLTSWTPGRNRGASGSSRRWSTVGGWAHALRQLGSLRTIARRMNITPRGYAAHEHIVPPHRMIARVLRDTNKPW